MLFRRPLHEVAQWPAWEVGLLEAFLAESPGPDERIEVAIAHLTAIYVNCHLAKDATPKTIRDFLIFEKRENEPKEVEGRYSEVDLQVLSALKA